MQICLKQTLWQECLIFWEKYKSAIDTKNIEIIINYTFKNVYILFDA